MNSRFFVPGVLLSFAIFLALDVWLVFVLSNGKWQDQAGLWFGIVGIFGLATGFISTTDLSKTLPKDTIDNLTSPFPRAYISGNLFLCAMSVSFLLAFVFGRVPGAGLSGGMVLLLLPVWLLGALLYIALMLLWLVVMAAYLIFVVPVAYLAYMLVGFPLLSISDGGEVPMTIAVASGSADTDESANPYEFAYRAETRNFNPREIVKGHMVPLRGYLVGALGAMFAFTLRMIALYS